MNKHQTFLKLFYFTAYFNTDTEWFLLFTDLLLIVLTAFFYLCFISLKKTKIKI